MTKNEKPKLPETPQYKTDPIFQQGYQDLAKYGQQLIAGDYSGLS